MAASVETGIDRIGQIASTADRAAKVWARQPRAQRADALWAVADRLDAAADVLIPIAMGESHLPEPRLRGELARTTFQLRLFADVVDEGSYLDVRIDHADAQWPVAPRPDLRRMRVPFGAVVVFAASNFPFAFSVAGGDSASALAAGCSVILKAHPGHPDLSAATADVVQAALAASGGPDGVFQVVFGDEAGRAALTNPLVKAAAFTGSITGGRALFDLAAARPEPIPFYAELGSVNPVFVMRGSDTERGPALADELVGSFTLGAGQFCTKPGVVLLPAASNLLGALRERDLPAPAPLLNQRITAGYLRGALALREHSNVEVVAEGPDPLGDPPSPTILRTDVDALLADPQLLFAECFGPTVLLVEYVDARQLLDVARSMEGQLTATLVANETETGLADLVATLAGKVGRLLWNQWPTGVSVTYAQQHGGPYPATTAPGTTSVGTAAIDRFTRPVAYQNFPQALLPREVRDDTALPRRIDGRLIPADGWAVNAAAQP